MPRVDPGTRTTDFTPAVLGYVSSSHAARRDDPDHAQQLAALEAFCARRGWDLVDVVHEVESPRRCTARPALDYAISRLSSDDVGGLVVTELARLCRSVAELRKVLDALERVSARLVSLSPGMDTGTESGRDAARILCAVSDWERRRAAERSRKGLAAARASGTIPPAIQPELQRRIARMRGAGMTLQAIVDELNAAGVPTVRGGTTWRPSSVQNAIGYKRPARGERAESVLR
jgi:DNA invertase Pin-like site-specific DNA recombinase